MAACANIFLFFRKHLWCAQIFLVCVIISYFRCCYETREYYIIHFRKHPWHLVRPNFHMHAKALTDDGQHTSAVASSACAEASCTHNSENCSWCAQICLLCTPISYFCCLLCRCEDLFLEHKTFFRAKPWCAQFF